MCLVALFHRVIDDAPILLGANREERYARPGTLPQVLEGHAVAGLDPVAGGTWLGVNAAGLVIALTNRPRTPLPLEPKSRGLLVRELLGYSQAEEALEAAWQALHQGIYAGCNILCVDSKDALLLHGGQNYQRVRLTPGLHVLTNGDVDDRSDPRIPRVHEFLSPTPQGCYQQGLTALEEVCALGGEQGPPICLHGTSHGTVSSTLLAIREPFSSSVYLHAQGAPDTTGYSDYSPLLKNLKGQR